MNIRTLRMGTILMAHKQCTITRSASIYRGIIFLTNASQQSCRMKMSQLSSSAATTIGVAVECVPVPRSHTHSLCVRKYTFVISVIGKVSCGFEGSTPNLFLLMSLTLFNLSSHIHVLCSNLFHVFQTKFQAYIY